MTDSTKNIIIVGGGLVGSVLSLYLVRKGYHVRVFEKRPDMRKIELDGGRSINLVMTSRGLNALTELGILENILEKTVPVYGRIMHSLEGQLTYQAYGIDNSECNYSVSRSELNKALISHAEKTGVEFSFEHDFLGADFEEGIAEFRLKDGTTKKIKAARIFGADGAGSPVRRELLIFLQKKQIPIQNAITPLGSDYKELFMPKGINSTYVMEKKALHIWPRGDHMLMALPNLDGSFTMTLYLQSSGDKSFASLKNEEDAKNLFQTEFSDSIAYMPNYLKDFFSNPTGKLATVKCNPWHYKDKVALIGDAAHAVVPFFGQGMNAGFEDCSVLNKIMDVHKEDWHGVFEKYSEYQKPNADAIADMAVENYNEMSSQVADPKFLLRKQAEQVLRNEFPMDFKNRYALVTYSLVPYHHVEKIGSIQREILDELCQNISNVINLDLVLAKKLLHQKLIPYQKLHNIKI